MRILFAVFGLALIITGAVLLLVPRDEPRVATRSVAPQVVSLAVQARDLAEKVNAPLSILFGLISLYYSRKRYIVERENHGGDKRG